MIISISLILKDKLIQLKAMKMAIDHSHQLSQCQNLQVIAMEKNSQQIMDHIPV